MKHSLLIAAVFIVCFISTGMSQNMKTVHADGSLTIKDADGKTTTIQMDAKTPYGEPIAGDTTVLRRDPFEIRLVYAEKRSDDILEGTIKDFYMQLGDVLRAKVTQKSFRYTASLSVDIEYCRFAETGYCKRKNEKQLTVRILANGAEVKVLGFNPVQIVNEKERKKCVEKVLQEFIAVSSR